MFNILKIFGKSNEEDMKSGAAKEELQSRYRAFQALLTANNKVLEYMADMEEKLSGEFLFDMHYIKKHVDLVSTGVFDIITHLNTLSHDKYSQFHTLHDTISQEMKKILHYRLEIPVSDFTIPLENLDGKMVVNAGGKLAHLGEVKAALKLLTPDGFSISSYAFMKFMEHNGLAGKIKEKLSGLGLDDLEEIKRVSKEIHDMIMASEVPPEIEAAIHDAYENLSRRIGRETMLSIRSSAIREDSDVSFAGQYATFLNVRGDLVLKKYKEVVASLFTTRAIFYYKTKGFAEDELVMAVGVINMVEAAAAGVMYTRDPNNPSADTMLINAAYGLGKYVVDGTVSPDSYVVSRNQERTILDKKIVNQEKMLICGPDGTLEELDLPSDLRDKQCITDEEIRTLSGYGQMLEEYYGLPQDIEWAVGRNRAIYILQTRPLRLSAFQAVSSSNMSIPMRVPGYPLILDKGAIACKGIGYGEAFVLEDDEMLKDFPDGAVLVARHTNPKYVTVMEKASAIVIDVGSVTGHMGSLSREYQVPTILDTENGTRKIPHSQMITVDAVNCNVYEGKVDELIDLGKAKREPFKDTHLFRTLQKVLKLIVPLNLVDPDSEEFKPGNCKTLHDITRFAHEVAMWEMFNMGDAYESEGVKTVPLLAGIPVDAHILDLEGGMKENIKKATPEDILSLPFGAMLKGMKEMRWPEPRPVDAKGFLGMLAHSASVPEDQLYAMGKKSFCILSRNYMNFSIRLGYHFSMVESYSGDKINDNYIRFFFKGGGAALDRRLRRVRLITEILRAMGFRVTAKEDVINAALQKYKHETIQAKLEVMGRLTAYTKQLDMVMFNDAVTDMYIEDFVRKYVV